MTLPIKNVRMPDNLNGLSNGNLPTHLLKPFQMGGGLLHPYARKWANRLVKDAALAGIQLTYTYGGCYRSFAQQETLFYQRFEPGYLNGGTNRSYKGQWWHLKPGMALAATPGTSNHGWGLAIDFALGTHPSNAKSLDSKALIWLIAYASRYGFSWELQSEPWHLRFVEGKRFKAQWSKS